MAHIHLYCITLQYSQSVCSTGIENCNTFNEMAPESTTTNLATETSALDNCNTFNKMVPESTTTNLATETSALDNCKKYTT